MIKLWSGENQLVRAHGLMAQYEIGLIEERKVNVVQANPRQICQEIKPSWSSILTGGRYNRQIVIAIRSGPIFSA